VGAPEGKGSPWRRRRRWKDNIKTGLQDVGWGGLNWVDLAQDRDRWRSSCECGNELSGSIKRGEFFD
jgi:hypothetical protein